MRVMHIITRMIVGGAQENTLLNCHDLIEEHGDDVLLVTGPSLGPEGSLLEDAQLRGVPVEIIPSLRRAINPWQDTASYREINRAIRRFQPDVVHTHSAKGGILGRAVAWRRRVPAVVHTVHGAPFHPFQSAAARNVYRACEQWAAHRCHALISVADAMTELMVQAGVAPREKFTTIYSGMEVEPFLHADRVRAKSRAWLGYDESHVVIGKIARLFPLKGHEYLIASAREVIQRCPQVRFLFVGDGILHHQLEQQITAAGLSEYFRFTGLVPPSRIPELIAAMDVVVHTSLREGLARVLPQGLIVGRPVVSYDIDGAREVAIPNETGYLLPPKSIEPLTAALVELAEDAELRQRLGAEGQRRFADLFRHQTMTRLIRELYQRVLANPHEVSR